jgi:hypothetical protein
MTKPMDANELFDALIGWAVVYPPSDADIAKAYDAAPESVQKAYNAEGISLGVHAPGEELWYGGPRATRWTIDLHDDWTVDFDRAIIRAGGNPDDEALWDLACALADAVEAACDKDLQVHLEKHPECNDELWTADSHGYYLK